MDEVMLTHACGCTQTMWVNVEGAERERYLAQLRAQDCTACQSPVEKATRAALRAAGPLRGTEKQVQWAERIRREAIEGVYGLLESSKSLAAKHGKEVDDLDLLERGACELGTHTEARFWIDGRARSPREWLADAAYRVMAQGKEQEGEGRRDSPVRAARARTRTTGPWTWAVIPVGGSWSSWAGVRSVGRSNAAHHGGRCWRG